MKKIFNIIILILALGFCLFGCNNDNLTEANPTLSDTTTKFVEESKNITETSTKIGQADNCGGIITVQKYRSCYYSIPSTFVELVGRGVYYEWINTVDYTESAEKMIMLQFVQHFDISREQFDKANYKIAKIILEELDGRPCMSPKDYANQISDEIYNGDIIYTFDDAIINEYYLSPDYPYLYSSEYDEAVANGTYKTRTTDWIDVEQMEAEIIAKYGETGQVENKEEPQSTETTDFSRETTQVVVLE